MGHWSNNRATFRFVYRSRLDPLEPSSYFQWLVARAISSRSSSVLILNSLFGCGTLSRHMIVKQGQNLCSDLIPALLGQAPLFKEGDRNADGDATHWFLANIPLSFVPLLEPVIDVLARARLNGFSQLKGHEKWSVRWSILLINPHNKAVHVCSQWTSALQKFA